MLDEMHQSSRTLLRRRNWRRRSTPHDQGAGASDVLEPVWWTKRRRAAAS